MSSNERLRVIFHGAVVLLVGLLCGLPTVPEEEPMRLWHTAHEGLIMIGVMMIAISSAMPVLRLAEREARGLVWALLAMGYGLMTALIIQGVTGQHVFSPSSSLPLMIGFVGSTIGIGGSVVSTALTIMGARAALVAARVTGQGERS